MSNSLYQSILSRLAKIAPLFAKSILDNAIKKRGKDENNVTAIELFEILRTEINPKLSKGNSRTDSLIQANSGHIIYDFSGKIIFMTDIIRKIARDLKFDQNNLFQELLELKFCLYLPDIKEFTVNEVYIKELKQTFDVSIIPLFDVEMRIYGAVSYIRDVTLKVALEDEIIIQTEKLKDEIRVRENIQNDLLLNQSQLIQASKLTGLGEMAGGIAHEINNPLSIIFNGVESIESHIRRGNINPENIEKNLERIKKSCMRIKGTVNAMRTLSRQQLSEDFESQPLSKIIDEVMALCHEKYITHGIQLNVINHFPQLHLACRPIEIGQVFINLLNNSYDAISDLTEKWITIEIHITGQEAQISFTDSGHGIPKDLQEKIFEPFFTTKPVGKGVGIGMSISKKIIENHGGRLFVDNSCPNTRLCIILPVESIQEKTSSH